MAKSYEMWFGVRNILRNDIKSKKYSLCILTKEIPNFYKSQDYPKTCSWVRIMLVEGRFLINLANVRETLSSLVSLGLNVNQVIDIFDPFLFLLNLEGSLYNWKRLDKILWKFARLIVELPHCWLPFELKGTSGIFCSQQSLENTQVGYILQKYTLDKYTLEK